MRYLKKTIQAFAIFVGILVAGQSYGQGSLKHLMSVAVAGHSDTAASMFYSVYNIGEPVIFTGFTDSVFASYGVLQSLGDTIAIKKDDMSVYPNPAYTTTATVKYVLGSSADSVTVTSIDIRIISLAGQMMFSDTKKLETNTKVFTYTFDTDKYNPGIYVITLFMDTGIKASRKFVRVRL